MPKVSVIIPTYNCARYLPEAIESVLEQSYQDFEVVIVDDGPTDNTREIVSEYVKKFSGKIKYFFQANSGAVVARNAAIKSSSGEYIAVLDADDIWLSGRLEEGVKVLEREPDVGLVHANISWMKEDGRVVSSPVRKKEFLSGRIFKEIFLRDAHISMPTVLVRSECFERVGLFDEHLTKLGCQDREMWLRVAQKYKFYYIDKVFGLYRMRSGSVSRDRDKMLKARYYVVDKFCREGTVGFLLKNRALARIHSEVGNLFLWEGKFSGARREFWTSIMYWPLAFWSWANFVKTMLKVRPKGAR